MATDYRDHFDRLEHELHCLGHKVDDLSRLDKQLRRVERKLDVLLKVVTDNNPALRALADRLAASAGELQSTVEAYSDSPATSSRKVDAMPTDALDTLTQQVEQNVTVEQSAVTLITGLAAQIEQSKTDPVKLQALADRLKTQAQALTDAITANTPVQPQGRK